MPFQTFKKPEVNQIPVPYPPFPQTRAIDPFATPKPSERPIVVTYMYMTKSETPMPPTPVYECDEFGVVIDGELTIKDENGTVGKFGPGDSFFVTRGSTIVFGSESNALVVKVAGRYTDDGWGDFNPDEFK
ncbi:hypothetical protein GQ53DRAFT_832012 [Thozetella sp. PMI_491]|nr:hypothetical protein GQ53DRAFT_832012 [Thozetella sp. PMI_491]